MSLQQLAAACTRPVPQTGQLAPTAAPVSWPQHLAAAACYNNSGGRQFSCHGMDRCDWLTVLQVWYIYNVVWKISYQQISFKQDGEYFQFSRHTRREQLTNSWTKLFIRRNKWINKHKRYKNMLNINDTTDTKLNALKMISCPINININEKRRVESYDWLWKIIYIYKISKTFVFLVYF